MGSRIYEPVGASGQGFVGQWEPAVKDRWGRGSVKAWDRGVVRPWGCMATKQGDRVAVGAWLEGGRGVVVSAMLCVKCSAHIGKQKVQYSEKLQSPYATLLRLPQRSRKHISILARKILSLII